MDGQPVLPWETPSSGDVPASDSRRRLSSFTSQDPRHNSVTSTTSGHGRVLPSIAAISGRLVQESDGYRRSISDASGRLSPNSIYDTSSDHRNSQSEPDFSARMNAPDTAVPTPRTLRNFAKIAVQYHEKERQRECRLAGHLEACNKHKEVFNRLQKWDHFRSSSRSAKLWQCIATRWQPPQIPNDEELLELAKHYFPPRSRLSIHIIDFKKDETIKHHNVELKDIEKYWTEKDDDVEVRWIHAPLGLGPVHSTIEDVFLHQAPEGEEGRNFENVGNSGWPYPQLEVLNFRSRARFQEMRDVRSLLQCLDHLQEDLNKCTWERYRPSDKNTDSTILDDLKWRATHLNITQDFNTIPDFWTQVSSDIPWQVTEGLAMASYGPLDGLKPTLQKIDHQALWDHDFFGSAQLVRDPFRCFHRGDGKIGANSYH